MTKILLVLFLLLSLFFPLRGFAQEATPTPTPFPQYTLPYPGLLPDSPLYFLKILREKVVLFLIADSLKKSEYLLLEADKYINAGVYLFEKGNDTLAQTIFAKGETYLEEAVVQASNAKKQGFTIDQQAEKLYLSTKKHQEVLLELAEKAEKKNKEQLLQQVKKARETEGRAKELLLKK